MVVSIGGGLEYDRFGFSHAVYDSKIGDCEELFRKCKLFKYRTDSSMDRVPGFEPGG